MAPEAHSEAVNFDPNGPGMGLDLDFNNFDVGNFGSDGINVDRDVANVGYNFIDFNNFDLGGLDTNIGMNYSANTNINFEDSDALITPLKEAELLLGPLELPNEKSEAPTLAEAYNTGTGTSTLQVQEPVHSNEMRAQKRKKTDEVDKGDILPEGSRRNRNKTARALGLDS
jgi:hypothetical protein